MMTATLAPEKIKEMAFNEWTIQNLKKRFNLNQLDDCKLLNTWLSMPFELTVFQENQLEELRQLAQKKILYWNENELKFHFLAPVMNLVKFNTNQMSAFSERTIKATFDDIKLVGKADLMIATGENEPEIPFFFFHEYKKEKGSVDDPVGQLMCAMLVGQDLNNNENPIYGAFVLGSMWTFVVLKKKEFCLSNRYLATRKEDLEFILGALINMKKIIEQELI